MKVFRSADTTDARNQSPNPQVSRYLSNPHDYYEIVVSLNWPYHCQEDMLTSAKTSLARVPNCHIHVHKLMHAVKQFMRLCWFAKMHERVCTCVYMYIYYVAVSVYEHRHDNTHAHTYALTYTYAFMHTAHPHTHPDTHHPHSHTHACMHVCVYIHIQYTNLHTYNIWDSFCHTSRKTDQCIRVELFAVLSRYTSAHGYQLHRLPLSDA